MVPGTERQSATDWGGSGGDQIYGVAATGNAGSDVVLVGATTSGDMPITANDSTYHRGLVCSSLAHRASSFPPR